MQIEIGDWVCAPSRKFEGPYCAAQVVKIESNNRVVIKVPHRKLTLSYPSHSIEKITEEQAMLMILER